MRRIVVGITIAAITASIATTASIAQNPPLGVGTTPQAGPPQTMDLAIAKKMVAAAEAAAFAEGKYVAICVMDTDGDVVLAERMNGADHNPVITAEGKARAALVFGISTAEIAQAVRDMKPISAPLRKLPNGLGGEYTFSAGGLPIMKDRKMIGAIGVGGANDDERLSQTGIDAISSSHSTLR